jgi:hypothetical protein
MKATAIAWLGRRTKRRMDPFGASCLPRTPVSSQGKALHRTGLWRPRSGSGGQCFQCVNSFVELGFIRRSPHPRRALAIRRSRHPSSDARHRDRVPVPVPVPVPARSRPPGRPNPTRSIHAYRHPGPASWWLAASPPGRSPLPPPDFDAGMGSHRCATSPSPPASRPAPSSHRPGKRDRRQPQRQSRRRAPPPSVHGGEPTAQRSWIRGKRRGSRPRPGSLADLLRGHGRMSVNSASCAAS